MAHSEKKGGGQQGELVLIDISAGKCVAVFAKAVAPLVPFCTHHFRPEKWDIYPQFREE